MSLVLTPTDSWSLAWGGTPTPVVTQVSKPENASFEISDRNWW